MFCLRKKHILPIIDWEAALEQCDGDKDFLYQILSETHKEITNCHNLEDYSSDFLREYAHMVKGVAQNLFCKDLEKSSSILEFVIIRDNNSKEIKKHTKKLKKSVYRFELFLKEQKIIEV